MWGAAQLSPRALWITAEWLPYRTALPQGRGKAKRERASPEHGVGRRHRYGAVGRQGRDSTEGFGVGCQRTLGGAAEALGASRIRKQGGVKQERTSWQQRCAKKSGGEKKRGPGIDVGGEEGGAVATPTGDKRPVPF
jgi:hypothetical protein